MVFYYTSNGGWEYLSKPWHQPTHPHTHLSLLLQVVDPPATLYMGRDKFENEDLIKFGFDIDVW